MKRKVPRMATGRGSVWRRDQGPRPTTNSSLCWAAMPILKGPSSRRRRPIWRNDARECRADPHAQIRAGPANFRGMGQCVAARFDLVHEAVGGGWIVERDMTVNRLQIVGGLGAVAKLKGHLPPPLHRLLVQPVQTLPDLLGRQADGVVDGLIDFGADSLELPLPHFLAVLPKPQGLADNLAVRCVGSAPDAAADHLRHVGGQGDA